MSLPIRLTLVITLLTLLMGTAIAGEVVVPFISGDAAIKSTAEGTVDVRIPDFATAYSSGNPNLPYVEKYVLLPPTADIKTLRVEVRKATIADIQGTYDVVPAPPAVAATDNGPQREWWGFGKKLIKNRKNSLVYESDSLYPANFAAIDSVDRLGNYILVSVQFWPYRYNPVKKKLTHLKNAEVVLVFSDKTGVPQAATAGNASEAARLKDLAVNYQQAGNWYSIPPATKSIAAASPIPFAIITTQAIVNSSTKLSDYVAHKTSMGYNVTVATEAQWGGGTGSAASEGIRRWLKTNYTTKAKYALLIGNPDPANGDVPMKLLWPRRGSGDGMDDCPSDYYYADVTGNWDYNDNGYYGEDPGDFVGTWGVDRIPEVIVGRIPYYGSIADLDSILQKTINYEASPTVGSWAQRVMLAMVPMDPQTPNWQLGEVIKNEVIKPSGYNAYRLYEDNYGLLPPPEKTPCTEDNVLNEWKNGYGFVTWATHGSGGGAAGVMSSGNAAFLDDTKPAFTFQASCDNGYPESPYNLGYQLLVNGAIATVSASRVAWYYPGETGFHNSDSMDGMAYLYAMKLINGHQKCGDALFNMKTGLPKNIWMNHTDFNLYGDPTVSGRWPSSFSIDSPSTLPQATFNKSYSINLAAAGGTTPYTWSFVSGNWPTGLTLSSAGNLAGTPTKSGTFTFTVKATDGAGLIATKALTLNVIVTAYSWNLDTNPNWDCEGDWQFGKPTGQGSRNNDPYSAHTGNNVYGNNLNGDYQNGLTKTQYLTTAPINCSGLAGTTLSFWRWIGIDQPESDNACIEASNDGVNWTSIWHNTVWMADWTWVNQIIDISSIADGHSTVYVRWGLGPTDPFASYSGWNIDDVQIIAAQTRPIIDHTPLKDTEDSANSYTVMASVITAGQLSTGNPILKWRANNGAFNSVQMGLFYGNTYVAQIPAQPIGTTVSYYISAADASATSVVPDNAPTQCYQFHVASDTTPPVITHTPLANTRELNGPYKVTATVTDNVGLASVVINWSKNDGSVSTVTMTKSASAFRPNDYYGYIPGPSVAGDWYNYSITATDSSGARNQTTTPSYMLNILPGLSRMYSFPMDTDPGWSCTGQWAFGTPLGQSGDPTSGHTGSSVYGYNLAGNYGYNMDWPEFLTTTPLDCSRATNVTLKFWRFLGMEGSDYDCAGIDASADGGVKWTNLWSNPNDLITETTWTQQSYDISFIADGKSDVKLRWFIGPTDGGSNYFGWNLDDVEIWGIWYDEITEIGNLKARPENIAFTMDGMIVSAAFPGYFYVQQPNGYQGIKVLWSKNVIEGAPVFIKGVIRTRNGEREILAEDVSQGNYNADVKPVAITVKSLGGSDFGTPPAGQRGTGPFGLNNIGTLVKIAGKVTQIGDGYFYVNDGSNVKDGTTTNGEENIGVRVKWTGTGRTRGEFITITGISTGFISGNSYIGEILPRRGTDINP